MDLTTLERLPLWIGGRAVAAHSTRYGEVLDPASGEVVRHVPLADAEDIAAAVSAASAAFPAWRSAPALRRARILMRFRDLMEAHKKDLARLVSQEHGKTLVDAAGQVEQANRSTTASVNERKATLESLVTTIDLRTADLDQRLSRFTSLLDESLAAAEERARDIARVVAETAGAGSAAISRQFEAVRAASQEEHRHTVESMHEAWPRAHHSALPDLAIRQRQLCSGATPSAQP